MEYRIDRMRSRLATTWLVHLAVLVFLVTVLVTTQTTTVSARHLPDVPAPICESLESGDWEEARLEHVTPSLPSSTRRTMATGHAGLVVLQLSPVIFQPPEAA